MLTIEQFNQADLANKKIMIISHNDLDCSGSILVCDKLFTDYKYLTVANGAVDKMVKMVLFNENYADREVILITDVSVTDVNLANQISEINAEGKRKIFLFDHHDTALWLNVYDWAVVTTDKTVSASKLFFQYMADFIREEVSKTRAYEIYDFLEAVTNVISDWDTWKWVEKGIMCPKDLSTLFSKTGINYFIEKYRNSDEILSDLDSAFLKDVSIKEKFIIMPGIKKTARNITVQFDYDYLDDSIGIILKKHVTSVKIVKCVSVAEAPGDLAEQLYEDGIDYVFMFYSNGTVSCRSRIEDVHLGHWAKHISGGGGHSMSAGFPLTADTLWIYDLYLKERYKKED